MDDGDKRSHGEVPHLRRRIKATRGSTAHHAPAGVFASDGGAMAVRRVTMTTNLGNGPAFS